MYFHKIERRVKTFDTSIAWRKYLILKSLTSKIKKLSKFYSYITSSHKSTLKIPVVILKIYFREFYGDKYSGLKKSGWNPVFHITLFRTRRQKNKIPVFWKSLWLYNPTIRTLLKSRELNVLSGLKNYPRYQKSKILGKICYFQQFGLNMWCN